MCVCVFGGGGRGGEECVDVCVHMYVCACSAYASACAFYACVYKWGVDGVN